MVAREAPLTILCGLPFSVNQGLTLLQRSVLKRLREQGFTRVAEQANRAWLRGQQFAPVNLNDARSDLQADFVEAQAQAPNIDRA